MTPNDDQNASANGGRWPYSVTRIATRGVVGAGRLLLVTVGGGRLIGHHTARHRSRPGDTPGIESVPDRETPPDPAEVTIQCTDYSPDDIQSWDVPFESLDELLQQSPPDGSAVRWINVNSVHPYLVDQFRQALGFHTLAAEDVLHVPQRPKVEAYEDHLFVVARMLTRDANGCLTSEQVSMFLYLHLLVTFQEQTGTCGTRYGDDSTIGAAS